MWVWGYERCGARAVKGGAGCGVRPRLGARNPRLPPRPARRRSRLYCAEMEVAVVGGLELLTAAFKLYKVVRGWGMRSQARGGMPVR